jgi:tRNA dimethylallyltransferase
VGADADEGRGIVITGATATGKSALALEVARTLGGEIISLDSRQIYRGLDVGTAKPTVEQRRQVPHHGIDIVAPDERYSAGQFARAAHAWISDIEQRGRVPILVGGTGFFLKAMLQPLFDEPEMPAAQREQLKQYFREKSPEQLRRWYETVRSSGEPARPTSDPQRMSRALEVALLTGYTLEWWHAREPAHAHQPAPLCFLLDLPRTELYERINQRVLDMIDAGLVEEVRSLVARGYDEHTPGMNTTGYIELLPYLRGETDLASAVDAIQRATRRYARRQATWFRHQLPPDTIHLEAREPLDVLVAAVLEQGRRR